MRRNCTSAADRAWARDYRKQTGRIPAPFPQPQPKTPLRGEVCELTFCNYRRARTGHAPAAVQRLFDKFGSYRVKPKRGSRGVVWNNRAFWWSKKGYYRPGFVGRNKLAKRRPLQHYIWEHHHGRAIPAKHEIWFVDRDRHNFAIRNLELLHKADLHRRCVEIGECRQITHEERMATAGKRWTRHSRRGMALLLSNFNQSKTSTPENYGHSETLSFLAQRREVITNGPRLPARRSAAKTIELAAA